MLPNNGYDYWFVASKVLRDNLGECNRWIQKNWHLKSRLWGSNTNIECEKATVSIFVHLNTSSFFRILDGKYFAISSRLLLINFFHFFYVVLYYLVDFIFQNLLNALFLLFIQHFSEVSYRKICLIAWKCKNSLRYILDYECIKHLMTVYRFLFVTLICGS